MSRKESPRSLSETFSRSSDDTSTSRLLVIISLAGLIVLSMIAGALLLNNLNGQPVPSTDVGETRTITYTGNSTSDYTALYNETHESVVSVHVYGSSQNHTQGTGFIYENGYIVTNHHVVAEGDTIYVRYAQGNWTTAKVVGTDYYTDLAVLKPSSKPSYAKALPVADTLPKRGQAVSVIGNPSGLRGSITTGVVSGTERTMRTGTGFSIPDMIQTDSPLNPGNSGGPLLTSNGQVVGVVNARQGENIGFAISSRVMTRVVDSVIEDGSHTHPLLGVSTIELTPRTADANGLDEVRGILVVETFSGTGSKGTLQPSTSNTTLDSGYTASTGGDVILAVDGHPVNDNEDLGSYLMRETAPGESVTLTILRDGVRETVTVRLTKRPDPSTSIGG